MNEILEILVELKTKGDEKLKELVANFKNTEKTAKKAGLSIDKFSKNLKSIKAQAIPVNREIKSLNTVFNQLRSKQTSMTGAFNRASISLTNFKQKTIDANTQLKDFVGTVRKAITALAGFQVGANIINTMNRLERLRVLLQGIEGDSERATKAFNYIREMASRTPFSLEALTNAYIKLRVAGLDPMKMGFEELVNAVAHFGGTSQDLELAALAISQMASKGVVSMEELRQQLGERIPSAVLLMARGLGYSKDKLQDFFKDVGNGAISADVAIRAMFKEFKSEYAGEAERRMDSLGGLLARLQAEWQNFVLRLSELGALQELKLILTDLIAIFASITQSKYFEGFVKGFLTVISAVRQLIEMILNLINTGLKPFDNELGSAVSFVVGFGLAIMSILKVLRMFKTSLDLAKTALIEFQIASTLGNITGISKAFSLLTIAIRGLGRALAFFKAGWIGLMALFAYGGWQLGDYLQKNYLSVRLFGFAIVEAIGSIYYNAKILWNAFLNLFTDNEQALKQARAEFERFKKDIEETVDLEIKQAQAKRDKLIMQKQINSATSQEQTANYNIYQQLQQQAQIEQQKKALVQQVAQLRQQVAQKYRQSLQAEKQLIAQIRNLELQKQQEILNINDTIFNLKLQKLSEEEQVRAKIEKAKELEAQAEKALNEQNYELAKQYLNSAKNYYAELGRAKDEALSEKGLEGLERIRNTFEKLYETQKEKAKQALEAQKKETEKLKKLYQDITKLLNELTKKSYSIDIKAPGLDAIVKQFKELKDKAITITVNKVEKTVEAHQTGGLVGITRFARGGKLPGYGGGDKIKALLEAGEFVIRKEAVQKYGTGLLYALNNMKLPQALFKTKTVINKIQTAKRETLRKFIININGAELVGYSTEEALREFEKINRRKGLLI